MLKLFNIKDLQSYVKQLKQVSSRREHEIKYKFEFN